jgi:thioesterase domain-containing protein
VESIPLTPTGKLDEKSLPAPDFGSTAPLRAPSTATEIIVASVFADSLGSETIGADDDYFTLGGNSLSAIGMLEPLRQRTQRPVQLQWLLAEPTVFALSRRIDTFDPMADESALDVVLPIRRSGTAAPLFCIHPIIGLSWSYAGLARYVDDSRPIYGLQVPGLCTDEELPGSIEATAARYSREIRRIAPNGPYHLLGWSLGGVIAHAVATQLEEAGAEVASLILLDSSAAPAGGGQVGGFRAADVLAALGIDGDVEHLGHLTADSITDVLSAVEDMPPGLDEPQVRRLIEAAEHNVQLSQHHSPAVFGGDVLFFTADPDELGSTSASETWASFVRGRVEEVRLPFTHWQMFSPASLRQAGPVIAGHLERAHGSISSDRGHRP